MKKTLSILLLWSALISWLHEANAQNTKPSADAVYALIARIIPAHKQDFGVAFIPKQNGKDVFEIADQNGKIMLSGSNGVSVASALNYYLKHYTHCDIGWNGTNLKLPAKLPRVGVKVRKVTPYTYRYDLNYCTFNYTMSWWTWDRWQQEIDWMALNGVNMPLAITGQNSIWQRVYKSLGFTDKDLSTFFSGPAYFNWFWMGNLDGWGGPLPQSFMDKHEALEKQILKRERELGMTPILPAFTGHVPPSFKTKFPNAKLKKTDWQGFPDVYILDPDDELFATIGERFIKEEVKTFGTDHLYSADTFNENTPPTNDSTYLDAVSKKVYHSMAAADPKATWIMQGWMFSYSAKFWQPKQIKALLNGIPNDHMIILDLYSENKPVWDKTDAYYGKPWIWCMLHNFGGNISLYGRMSNVAADPANALNDPRSGKILGIGLTPEAIEQNPVMYELMMENVWRDKPIELDAWLNDYAYRRYGKKNAQAEAAWQVLKNTVYTGGIRKGGNESIISGRPTLAKSTLWANPQKFYRSEDLVPAWRDLITAADDLKNSQGFRYDLVDVTRQVLANYADTLHAQFAKAIKAKDLQGYKKLSAGFLGVMDDIDKLLSTRKDFLLGRWLEAAKANGSTPEEKRLYEFNARDQITLWGDKNSVLNDYACKQWAGMLSGFYKPRWQQFFAYADKSLADGKALDEKTFQAQIKDWEWTWVNKRDIYTTTPKGDEIVVAKEMYKKYFDRVK
ncbi:alpha-N-acetylglucosaminidase [Mucilaginibacter mali]|uniref:Alpha-N-acetylglucosaminidase n=1 Tax=Mucilaginibacter mali TaxID=2740462 RepID=A0A7D4Q897_9SPHI|nr:alpha-N-acetylglucosaminidase [Mucilaginibacter mali]QKJ30631.1 alpha-N-acetylglucosaminidase [Mucilaginibacter mali]